MAKVLLVGYIVELLQERERTLQDAGYQVTVALVFHHRRNRYSAGAF